MVRLQCYQSFCPYPALASGSDEVDQPEEQYAVADGISPGGIVHQLPRKTFEKTGADQHYDHASHHQRCAFARSTGGCKVRLLAGKGNGTSDMDACRSGQKDSEQLRGAVNRKPANKFHRQAALRKHPQHRTKEREVVDQQQYAGNGKGKSERKGEYRNLRIVAEQVGSKTPIPS